LAKIPISGQKLSQPSSLGGGGHVEIVVVFLTVLLGFLLYHFFSEASFLQKRTLQKIRRDQKPIYREVFKRLIGFLLLGVIPLSIELFVFSRNMTELGLSLKNLASSLSWVVILSAFMIPVNFLNARTEDNLKMYPQIRYEKWDLGLISLSAATWMLYLLAFEFLFRGFFLFSCERAFGYWPAIAGNTVVHSLVHLPKGKKETLGAIPFGAILCFLTLKPGTLWAAYGIHVVLALSNEWMSLASHPEMEVLLFTKSGGGHR